MVTVPTSAGEVSVDDLGVVLMHEPVFIRTEALQWNWPGFGGWDEEAEVAAARDVTRLARAVANVSVRTGTVIRTHANAATRRGLDIHNGVLPGLRDRGVPEEEIEQMLARNPREFFAQGGGA